MNKWVFLQILSNLFCYSILLLLFFFSFILNTVLNGYVFKLNNVIFILFRILNLIRELINKNLNIRKSVFYIWYLDVFIFCLFFNSVGLLPYNFSVVGSLLIVLLMSLSSFLTSNLLGLVINNYSYFNIFMPPSLPLLLLPLMFLIEFLTYGARSMTPAIRLFANILAGHILLVLVSSFSFKFFKSGYFLISIIPVTLIFLISVLEIGVVVIQSFIFVLLLILYYGDTLNLKNVSKDEIII